MISELFGNNHRRDEDSIGPIIVEQQKVIPKP